jgi:hypothetical protein
MRDRPSLRVQGEVPPGRVIAYIANRSNENPGLIRAPFALFSLPGDMVSPENDTVSLQFRDFSTGE